MEEIELRVVIMYLFSKNVTKERVNQDLQGTLEANTLLYSIVAHWCAETFIKDCSSLGSSNNGNDRRNGKKLEKMVLADYCVIVRFMGVETKISTGGVHSNLHDPLGMNEISARWVLKILTDVQK
ncbi:hypothetical protein EVAR_7735_1 [Eumeta japonica]|uniref:Uncharacterized protein n=1 Tax=Eumeta variegata TaxID=151549 RepID=A0A4C1TMA2_EUMVA|nr:hypothetical protein EVAR_7735_1 [Eumeta japonica]